MLCRWQARRRHIDWVFLLQARFTLLNLWPRAWGDELVWHEQGVWWDAGVQQLAIALMGYYSSLATCGSGHTCCCCTSWSAPAWWRTSRREQLAPSDVPRRLLRLYLALLLLYVGARKSDAPAARVLAAPLAAAPHNKWSLRSRSCATRSSCSRRRTRSGGACGARGGGRAAQARSSRRWATTSGAASSCPTSSDMDEVLAGLVWRCGSASCATRRWR